VASIVGATLGGIVGVLLAIPVASAAQIVVIELLSGTASGRRAHLR
jgi:predicted PurR-regulated permease PerM